MKRLLSVLFLFTVLAVFSVAGRADAAQKTYSLKLGHTGAPSHHYQTICLEFAERVRERTDGGVTISVFPSDQLGRMMESAEGVMLGTIDMMVSADMALSNWVPDFGILTLPFLFQDLDETRVVLDGPLGRRIAEKLEPEGAVVIAYLGNGLRHITNNKKPILVPDDLKGMKLRVPDGGEVGIETFKILGAGPTVISFGELYSALQLGTVDGQENPPAHILAQRFYEVQKYASLTAHQQSCSPLIMNKALLESMPQEYQDAIREVGREIGPLHNTMLAALEADQWRELAGHGMIINEVDTAPFREKVAPVIDTYRKKLDAALIDDIIATLAEYRKNRE
ncbi:MAG: TRAP transporter substrate-binding protein [Planctomycetaceae bacterium]|nr:TRAP transporter substrate-binding protein [Planctomycetaceae bacterium]